MKNIDGVPVLASPKGKREREVRLLDVVATAVAKHLRLYLSADGRSTWRGRIVDDDSAV